MFKVIHLLKYLVLILFLLPTTFLFANEDTNGAASPSADQTVSQDGYVPLADLPGINAESASDVGTYVNAFFRLAIGIGSVLAVLMIVVGGFQYLSTDNFGAKGAGKERINNALIGLGILLTSVLLLSTINSELLDVSPELTQAESKLSLPDGVRNDIEALITGPNGQTLTAPALGDPAALGAGQVIENCRDCVLLPDSVERRQARTGDYVDREYAQRLIALDTVLGDNGIDMVVTEAMPRTRGHAAGCHKTGTCVDYNFKSRTGQFPSDLSQIATVIGAAESLGLRAQYEVRTTAERDRLYREFPQLRGTQNGRSRVLVVPQATAAHFSLYSG